MFATWFQQVSQTLGVAVSLPPPSCNALGSRHKSIWRKQNGCQAANTFAVVGMCFKKEKHLLGKKEHIFTISRENVEFCLCQSVADFLFLFEKFSRITHLVSLLAGKVENFERRFTCLQSERLGIGTFSCFQERGQRSPGAHGANGIILPFNCAPLCTWELWKSSSSQGPPEGAAGRPLLSRLYAFKTLQGVP